MMGFIGVRRRPYTCTPGGQFRRGWMGEGGGGPEFGIQSKMVFIRDSISEISP